MRFLKHLLLLAALSLLFISCGDEPTSDNTDSDGLSEISAVKGPEQLAYLEDLDRIAAISKKPEKKMVMFNHSDNSLVWEKQLDFIPYSFTYSSERRTLYLVHEDGIVDSLDPNTGQGGKLFDAGKWCLNAAFYINDKLILFSWVNYGNYVIYDFNTKQIADKWTPIYTAHRHGTSYNPHNERMYICDYTTLNSYHVDGNGTLTDRRYAEFVRNTDFASPIFFDSLKSLVYMGDGYVYGYSSGSDEELTYKGTIFRYTGLCFVGDKYAAGVFNGYRTKEDIELNPTLFIYDRDLNLLGTKEGIAGIPLYIFNNGDKLKVYGINHESVLISQEFKIEDIIAK